MLLEIIDVHARITNICDSHKNFEWILLVWLPNTSLHVPLDFCLSLFSCPTDHVRSLHKVISCHSRGETKVLFIAPQY